MTWMMDTNLTYCVMVCVSYDSSRAVSELGVLFRNVKASVEDQVSALLPTLAL